jgi:hypothetical protein
MECGSRSCRLCLLPDRMNIRRRRLRPPHSRMRHTRFSTSAEFFEPKAMVLHTATSILAARAMFGM